jgi:hypothetical protein
MVTDKLQEEKHMMICVDFYFFSCSSDFFLN